MTMRSPLRRDDIFPFALFAMIVVMWTAWAAALLKAFNAWAVLLVALAVSLLAWRWVRPGTGGYLAGRDRKERAVFIAALVLIAVVSILNFYFFHDSLNGNRDEGIYSNDAVYLAEHGDLPFPRLRGADTRLFLNTAWNAGLYGLMGYTGLRLCNVVPFALALVCIFLLVEDLSDEPWAGLAAVALISLSYPFLWYARRTNNEIFFFSLFWIIVYSYHRCLRRGDTFRTDFTIFMLAAPLPAFVRPEGLLVSGVCCVGAAYLFLRRGRKARLYRVLPFAVLMAVLIAALVGGYALMSTKYRLGAMVEKYKGGGTGSVSTTTQASGSGTGIYSRRSSYTAMAMIAFGLLPALLMVVPFFVLLFLEHENRAFAVFFAALALPFALFLFKPNIAFDLPWFMRRFVSVIVPLSLIAFTWVAFKLGRTRAAALIGVYLTVTLIISVPVVFHQDYPGVNERLEELASYLPDDARVLVDRYTLGDYTLSGPLFFAYGRDVLQVTPWVPTSREEVGDHDTVYLVTNAEDWRNRFAGGTRVFDASVNVDGVAIEKEMLVPVSFLQPTCEFHRAGNEDTWTSMDWRIALANVAVPSKRIAGEYRVLVLRLDISTASTQGDEGGAE